MIAESGFFGTDALQQGIQFWSIIHILKQRLPQETNRISQSIIHSRYEIVLSQVHRHIQEHVQTLPYTPYNITNTVGTYHKHPHHIRQVLPSTISTTSDTTHHRFKSKAPHQQAIVLTQTMGAGVKH